MEHPEHPPEFSGRVFSDRIYRNKLQVLLIKYELGKNPGTTGEGCIKGRHVSSFLQAGLQALTLDWILVAMRLLGFVR